VHSHFGLFRNVVTMAAKHLPTAKGKGRAATSLGL
jgi:hypothetical protein